MASDAGAGGDRRIGGVSVGTRPGADLSAPGARIQALGFGWRHAGRRGWALRDIELEVQPGERVLLVGPSGAGKSTLLLALAGLLDPAGGGEARGRLTVDGLATAHARDRSALLLQDPDAQVILGRVGDDVAFGLENRCVAEDAIWPRVRTALNAVGFPYGLEHSTDALSGGERQRLALAGILALRPRLVLLDEPTASLDAEGQDAFRAALRSVLDAVGATLVMVEHRVGAALDIAQRLVALDGSGRVIADGPAMRVIAERADALHANGVWLPARRAPEPARDEPAVAGDVLLQADGLAFTYPGANAAALPPTDLALRSGETLAVVGPNGSGKSTLALLAGGLLRPGAGDVRAVGGLRPAGGEGRPWRWPARLLAGRIGSVFQNPEHQFLCGSVRDELRIGPRRLAFPDAERRADALMEELELGQIADANPFTLSGGERRRLSVGTALATAPPVLVLDEPTFGQDRRTWQLLLRLLARLRDDGRALLVVTHDSDFVAAIADRVITLPSPRRAD